MSSYQTSSGQSSSSTPQYFPVYLVKFNVAMQDPDIPGPRYHHVVFVETRTDGSGIKFHVVGDITRRAGMTYESKMFRNPESSLAFRSKELLGYTPAENVQSRWDAVLGALPTPPKQKEYNTATNRTEVVKSWDPITFYSPGEQRHQP
ncbi:hypothetical protein RB601_004496 [Gaeumannomyces tritici]